MFINYVMNFHVKIYVYMHSLWTQLCITPIFFAASKNISIPLTNEGEYTVRLAVQIRDIHQRKKKGEFGETTLIQVKRRSDHNRSSGMSSTSYTVVVVVSVCGATVLLVLLAACTFTRSVNVATGV